MYRVRTLLPTVAVLVLAAVLQLSAALAAGIAVEDAYVRVATPAAKAGAVFMLLRNTGDSPDQLIGARTEAAVRTELHSHRETANGVMRMIPAADGFGIPAKGYRKLGRGGDHIMLMGLVRELVHGDTITLTLIFRDAGEITLDIPVMPRYRREAWQMTGSTAPLSDYTTMQGQRPPPRIIRPALGLLIFQTHPVPVSPP